MADVVFPDDWSRRVAASNEAFCRDIQNATADGVVPSLRDSAGSAHGLLAPHLSDGTRVLEVGSGYGVCLVDLLKRGVDAVGVEPGSSVGFEGRHGFARELLEANGCDPRRVVQAAGEDLPFPDDSFDVVFNQTVLEHVRDVRRCVTEALRVAKPGGAVVMAVPSYHSFFEGHYRILWLPWLRYSKTLAKIYVRLLFGRKGYYVDELNFLTPGYFRRLVKDLPQAGRMHLQLYMTPRFRKIGPVERAYQRYYLHYNNVAAGATLDPAAEKEFRRCRLAVRAFESLGFFDGFTVTLRKARPVAGRVDVPAQAAAA